MATAQGQQPGAYQYGSGATNVVVTPGSPQAQGPRVRRTKGHLGPNTSTVNRRGDTRSVPRQVRRAEQLVPDRIAEDVQRARSERTGRSAATAAAAVAPTFEYVPPMYHEAAPDTVVRRQLPHEQERINPIMLVKVTRASVTILTATLAFWFIQATMVLVGIGGLAIVAADSANITFTNVMEANSWTGFFGTIGGYLGSRVVDAVSDITSLAFGFQLEEIGFAIYLGTSMVIFMIGICSVFFAWFMYTLNGINSLKGTGGISLILTLGLYLTPILQLFPWIVLFVASVWWAHKKV